MLAKLLGTAHHLVTSRRSDAPDLTRQVRRIVAALMAGMDTGASEHEAASVPSSRRSI